MYDKLILVTAKTRLEQLVERYNTREQAKFYVEHMGVDFSDYEREHETYHAAVAAVEHQATRRLPKVQRVERGFLSNFIFAPNDIVATVGRDGLVVNTAKYLDGHPIVAVNPDPARWDGILMAYQASDFAVGLQSVLRGDATYKRVTMAEAVLNDGQRLLAFNEFLVGQKTHVSARYTLRLAERSETQSSSGVLVSTGAGSTGWLSSAFNMARAVSHLAGDQVRGDALHLEWNDRRLVYVVREPFRSRSSGVDMSAGVLGDGAVLEIESQMPEGGVIFSDGVEADALSFNAGMVVRISAAQKQTLLVAKGAGSLSAG